MTDKHLIVVEHNGVNILKSTYCAILASNEIAEETSAIILAKDKATYNLLSKQIEKHVANIYGICDENFQYSIAQSYALAIEHVVNNKNFNYIFKLSQNHNPNS